MRRNKPPRRCTSSNFKLFIGTAVLMLNFINIYIAFTLVSPHFEHEIVLPPAPERRREISPKKENVLLPHLTFSACLLVRDDDHDDDGGTSLMEWIAYHYHTLPLRNLIVASDPDGSSSSTVTSSRTKRLLNRWNNSQMGMDIVQWKKEDYIPRELLNNSTLGSRNDKRRYLKQQQQRDVLFLRQCLNHHKKQNRSWTIVSFQTNDYFLFNNVDDDDPGITFFRNNEDHDDKPYTFVGDENTDFSDLTARERRMMARTRLPYLGSKTVAEYVLDETDREHARVRDCIVVPRLRFGLVESENDILRRGIPEGFDPKKFRTLRYFKHAKKGVLERNGLGNVMVDVSKISYESLELPDDYLTEDGFDPSLSVHAPLKTCKQFGTMPYEESLFRINHYTTQANPESEARSFETPSSINDGTSYDMKPWLRNFVAQVGRKKAKELLAGVDVKG